MAKGTYRDDRQNRQRLMPGHIARIIWVLIVLVILLFVAAAVTRAAYYRQLQPVSGSQNVVQVKIEPGTPSTAIADQLYDQSLIRSSTMFQWYVRTKNVRDNMKAGTYALRPSMTVPEIVNELVEGSIASDLLTILPGQRLDQIRQAFISAGFKPDMVDAALRPNLYAGHPALVDKPAGATLEGYIYPDSYQKNEDTDPSIIITEALDEMAAYLTPDVRAAFATHGLSVYEGVILASIIEKEVSNAADSAKVAQVFLKRLTADIPLGSDPTNLYGAVLAGGKPSLDFASEHNTYTNKGLPPTPISNVSKISLKAVARPAETNWLFFVAGDDGVTYFSNTLAEHEALTERHCKLLCR